MFDVGDVVKDAVTGSYGWVTRVVEAMPRTAHDELPEGGMRR